MKAVVSGTIRVGGGMLHVVLVDGTVEDLPDATQTIAQKGVLIVVCPDANGQEVRVYDRFAVVMFSHDDEVKRLAEGTRFEVCGFAAARAPLVQPTSGWLRFFSFRMLYLPVFKFMRTI